MKLIDLNKLDGCKLCTADQFPRDRRTEGWNDCIEYLQKCCMHVPVVEVVQCKDCLYAMKITEAVRFKWDLRKDALQCGLIGHIVLPDGYCDSGVSADAEVEE